MYYRVGDIECWHAFRFAGFVDFCEVDYMSRVELVEMARELKLVVDGCSLWFKDTKGDKEGMSKSKNDLDAVVMALDVDDSMVKNLYVKVTNVLADGMRSYIRNASYEVEGVGQENPGFVEHVEENVDQEGRS